MKRRSRKENPWKTMVCHRYPALGVVSDVTNHFILAFQSGRGPKPDVNEFERLISQASTRVCITPISHAQYVDIIGDQLRRGIDRLIPAKQMLKRRQNRYNFISAFKIKRDLLDRLTINSKLARLRFPNILSLKISLKCCVVTTFNA